MLQFIKYAIAGGIATAIQTGVFYILAATVLACLGPDDIAVRFCRLPSVELSDGVRAWRSAVAQGAGFVIANFCCWLMNRRFVFTPGRHRWYVELGMFYAASTTAFFIGVLLQSFVIGTLGWQTSLGVAVEIATSLAINFVVRKFFIFKG